MKQIDLLEVRRILTPAGWQDVKPGTLAFDAIRVGDGVAPKLLGMALFQTPKGDGLAVVREAILGFDTESLTEVP